MFLRKLCSNNIFPVHNRNDRNVRQDNLEPSSPSSLSISTSTSRITTTSTTAGPLQYQHQRQGQSPPFQLNNQQNLIRQLPSPPPPSLSPSASSSSQRLLSLSQSSSSLSSFHNTEVNNNHHHHHQERILQAPSPPPSYSVHCPPSASVTNTTNHQHRYQYGYTVSESSEESDTERFQQTHRLRGAYCPDLLHACSLILPSQKEGDDSTTTTYQENTISRRSLSFSSLDYAEIDDICQQFSQISSSNEATTTATATTTNQFYYQKFNAVSNNFTNENCNENYTHQNNDGNRGEQKQCITGISEKAMGQNLSLRKPRISMTWVLREQQQQQQQYNNHNNQQQQEQSNGSVQVDTKNTISKNNDNNKKKFKTKNKEEKLISEKLVNHNHNHNLQEYQEKREPCKDLFFVCSPQKRPTELHRNNDIVVRRRNEVRKTSDRRSFNKVANSTLEKYETTNEDLKSLKGTYSEPSLIAASEGNPRRHRHRKRRDRNRLQKFGYEIRNVDEFLSKCSLSSPGNIPVVLSSSSTLYQTRPGGYQIEIPLPLGMVVNAVFKNENWLYVQTPHAEEGYVGYASCLPLGILPPAARTTSTSRPAPCWETNGDVFPRPCGNMTDSEKEVRLRGGTRSDGARTPRPRRLSSSNKSGYGEHHVDKLYLRAASQPRLTEKSYAQLRPTAMCRQHHSSAKQTNDDYIILKKQETRTTTTTTTSTTTTSNALAARKSYSSMAATTKAARGLRQTLVAITNDYATDSITVRKGEIVTLLNCKESKERRQWFYIKTRDGREGFVPAEFAGHGFL